MSLLAKQQVESHSYRLISARLSPYLLPMRMQTSQRARSSSGGTRTSAYGESDAAPGVDRPNRPMALAALLLLAQGDTAAEAQARSKEAAAQTRRGGTASREGGHAMPSTAQSLALKAERRAEQYLSLALEAAARAAGATVALVAEAHSSGNILVDRSNTRERCVEGAALPRHRARHEACVGKRATRFEAY